MADLTRILRHCSVIMYITTFLRDLQLVYATYSVYTALFSGQIRQTKTNQKEFRHNRSKFLLSGYKKRDSAKNTHRKDVDHEHDSLHPSMPLSRRRTMQAESVQLHWSNGYDPSVHSFSAYFPRTNICRASAIVCTGSSSRCGIALSSLARWAGTMHWVNPRRCTSLRRCSR